MDTLTPNPKVSFENELHGWIGQEKAAVELINMIATMWYDRSVELVIFRNTIYNKGAAEILSLHTYADQVMHLPISIFDTLEVVRTLFNTELSPSRIDIGRLTAEYTKEKANFESTQAFIGSKLGFMIGKEKRVLVPKDVVLYGFGRIGRLAARELISQAGKGEQLRLRAIVTRTNSDSDIIKRAALLRKDSVHGPFHGNIIEDLQNKAIIINGHVVQMIAANNPEDIDYESYGITNALVIDNTGVLRDRDGLSRHLKSKGVSKVLLTAPGKGNIPNIVHGVNHEKFDINNEQIFSAASCTTNAIIPPLKVMNEKFGIIKGHIETIHSYTNDQNLLDNFHKKERRGRSAALNMVLTETGANSAITKVLPELSGKFTANAVRVPTPDVSLAILNLTLNRETSVAEVNEALRDAALNGDLVEQLQFSTDEELVSSDLIGNSCASIIDAPNTILSEDKRSVVVYAWYDNEYGYTRQVIRLAKHLADVVRLRYY
ncbi:MAG: glyceraldehyde-3-phosphate dehydrogenase [Bacteroidia bacterium]|nr:glyceraldehyde-3-phosphate dehydrogenase [Bacteroidia bacterium]